VDVGPSSTAAVLFAALDRLGVSSLDAIFLTHLHIDHAGGVGDVVERFPDTPVVCHFSGLDHLRNPSRLWEGSLKVLGSTARAYGMIRPVPDNLLVNAEAFRGFQIEAIPTPGHASHHVCYGYGPFLFAGEAAGVFIQVDDTKFYLRPATPPRFFLETSINSLDRLLDTPHRILCYGHFGSTERTPETLDAHKRQLYLWADLIGACAAGYEMEDTVEKCMDRLLEKDPLLKQWHRLDQQVQKRERYFLQNSIRGFLQYLAGDSR